MCNVFCNEFLYIYMGTISTGVNECDKMIVLKGSCVVRIHRTPRLEVPGVAHIINYCSFLTGHT